MSWTAEEKRMIEDMRRDQQSLLAKTCGLEGKCDTTHSLLRAHTERNSDEHRVLFEARDEVMRRVGKIERDYVPERDHKAHVDLNRQGHEALAKDHKALEKTMTHLGLKLAGIGGAVTLAAFLVGKFL